MATTGDNLMALYNNAIERKLINESYFHIHRFAYRFWELIQFFGFLFFFWYFVFENYFT